MRSERDTREKWEARERRETHETRERDKRGKQPFDNPLPLVLCQMTAVTNAHQIHAENTPKPAA